MTYCCALRLQDGLVFISDTRTNAGVDHISVFRKLYTFGVEGERFIAIQTSGNLATTQAVIGHLKNHLELSQEPNLYSVNTMFEAAELVGHTLKKSWRIWHQTRKNKVITTVAYWSVDKLKGQKCNFIIFIRRGILFVRPKIRRIFKLVKVNMASRF